MNSAESRSPSFSMSLVGTVLGLLLVNMADPSYAQMRLEMRPVETITLTTQQFLTGDKNGMANLQSWQENCAFQSQEPINSQP
jgi:hypothetical protein